MHYNFAADSCSRFSSREARFYAENGRFAFFSPPLEGLEATYYDYLRLTEKCAVDLILVLIERFSLGVTADALRVNIGSKPGITFRRGLVDPKFQVKMVAHQLLFFSENKAKSSCGIKMWTDLSSVLSQCTRLTDRQTDRQMEGRRAFSSLDCVTFTFHHPHYHQHHRHHHIHRHSPSPYHGTLLSIFIKALLTSADLHIVFPLHTASNKHQIFFTKLTY